MLKGSLLIWLALGCLAFTLDWGFFWLLSLSLILCVSISGTLVSVYNYGREAKVSQVDRKSLRIGTATVIKRMTDLKKENDELLKVDDSVTEIPEVDNQLNMVLDYLVRDYVVPWSRQVSCTGNNRVLDESFKQKLRNAIGQFAKPFRSIDWVDYFTAQLVDDFATHLHLYRVALERVKFRRQSKQQGVSDDELIEAAFFEAEAELGEPHVSREAVSRNAIAETAYFEGISDVLLSQLVSSTEFESGPFRHLSRSVLVWAVFRPLLDAIANPDLFNRTVIWLCRTSPVPPEHFNVIARTSTDSEELTAVLERVSFELSRCHALDALTESHELREQLAALYQLQQLCDRRLLELQMPRARSSAMSSMDYSTETVDDDDGPLLTMKKVTPMSVSAYGLSSFEAEDETDPNNKAQRYASLPVTSKEHMLIGIEPNLINLNEILNNPTLLDSFTEYLKKRKMYQYLTFFLNAQAFATSFAEAIHRLSSQFYGMDNDSAEDTKSVSLSLGCDTTSIASLPDTRSLPGGLGTLSKRTSKSLLHMVSNNAGTLFENYLSPRADSSQSLRLDEGIVSRTYNKIEKTISFLQRIENENIDVLQTIPTDLFGEALTAITAKLESKALPGFRQELNQQIRSQRASPNRRLLGNSPAYVADSNDKSASLPVGTRTNASVNHNSNNISARIIDANKVLTNAESFVFYIIHVSSLIFRPSPADGDEMHGKVDGLSWNTSRRYRDFAELHSIVKDRFPNIASRLHFPKKLLFNNLSDDVITKRMRELGDFLAELLRETTAEGCLDRESASSLKMMLLLFLQPGPWDRCGDTSLSEANSLDVGRRHSSHAPLTSSESDALHKNNGANRLGQVFKAIKTLPDRVDKTVDKLFSFMDIPEEHGLSQQGGESHHRLTSDRTSVYKFVLDEVGLPHSDSATSGIGNAGTGPNIASDPSLNIPMRILLRLGHEIFDLGSPRHDWLRTQFVDIFSRIVTSTHGTSMNKKIVGQVEWLTSRDQVVTYIRAFRDLMWPNGQCAASSLAAAEDPAKAHQQPTRHPHSRQCARLVCKSRMLGMVPDELRTVLGAEATREATVQLFELFQCSTLNRRLVIVVFEGLLRRLYPQINFDEVFRRLHTNAKLRAGADSKTSQPTTKGTVT